MKSLATIFALTVLTACAAQPNGDTHSHSANTHTHDTDAQARVEITMNGDQRCITSNGVPEHEVGTWRPGAIVEPQDHKFCMTATPKLTGTITRRIRISGITVTGIPLRPGTAEYYDPTAERGWSRDRSSGWNLEGVGGLRMDAQNAHVDGDGMYHYHGIPSAVVDELGGTLFGYAADGFEIHYVGDAAQPSWQLRLGERESGPGGAFDGTYVQDYEYVAGSGNLDECNGATRNGQYIYYATDTYPFFPRCFKGTVSSEFIGGRGGRDAQAGERPPRPERD